MFNSACPQIHSGGRQEKGHAVVYHAKMLQACCQTYFLHVSFPSISVFCSSPTRRAGSLPLDGLFRVSLSVPSNVSARFLIYQSGLHLGEFLILKYSEIVIV